MRGRRNKTTHGPCFPRANKSFPGRNNLPAVIMPTRGTDMVRSLQLTAIGAFGPSLWAKRMMRTPHVAHRGRRFSFGNGHCEMLLNGALRWDLCFYRSAAQNEAR